MTDVERDGVLVILADGQPRWLPARRPGVDDPDYDAHLVAWAEAGDASERFQAVFALTIFLITRGQRLEPGELNRLLDFGDDDPREAALWDAVGRMAEASLPAVRTPTPPEPAWDPVPRPRWSRWFRAVWPLWTL